MDKAPPDVQYTVKGGNRVSPDKYCQTYQYQRSEITLEPKAPCPDRQPKTPPAQHQQAQQLLLHSAGHC